jgi:hypothetical protein
VCACVVGIRGTSRQHHDAASRDGTSTTCTPYYAERTTDLDGSTRVIVYGRMRDDEPDPDYPNGYDGKADFKAADDAPEWARDLFADVIR